MARQTSGVPATKLATSLLDIQKEQELLASTPSPATQSNANSAKITNAHVNSAKTVANTHAPPASESTPRVTTVPLEYFVTNQEKKSKKKKENNNAQPTNPWGNSKNTRGSPSSSGSGILTGEKMAKTPENSQKVRAPTAWTTVASSQPQPKTKSGEKSAKAPENLWKTQSAPEVPSLAEIMEIEAKAQVKKVEQAKKPPKPLAKIQIEEAAMQQIAQMYSMGGMSVRVKLATN